MIRKHKAALAYVMALLIFTTYVIMDTFFITRVYGEETDGSAIVSEQNDDQDTLNESDGSGSMADQFASDNSDGTAEGGNMHSGSGGPGSSGGRGSGSMNGGTDGSGASGGRGPGSGHGAPGNHSGGHKPGSSGSGNSGSGSKSSGTAASGSSTSGSSASSSASGSSSSGSSSASSSSGSLASSGSKAASAAQAVTTADTYQDDNISITLKEYRENDTTIYAADVQVSSPEYLKTALAQGSYGRNVTAKTSETASGVNAVLAINGDYYGAQEKGYVIRNGKLYRDTAIAGQEDLVIYKDGSMGIINESSVTAQQLISAGAQQVLSFGPALVQNGSISVAEGEEVGQAMASNPRTAIGIIDENHYVFVVSDGRTSESTGLSLYQLAQFMDSLGVRTAYNLDGGGSSTMYFNGQVINNPTTGGSNIKERSVSDIVYIG